MIRIRTNDSIILCSCVKKMKIVLLMLQLVLNTMDTIFQRVIRYALVSNEVLTKLLCTARYVSVNDRSLEERLLKLLDSPKTYLSARFAKLIKVKCDINYSKLPDEFNESYTIPND